MFAKANYVNTKGIGGIILWELGGGYQASAPAGSRDKLLQAVKQAFMGGAPAPTDSIRPTAKFTAPAGNAVLALTVTVAANASDNVGVAGVQFMLDGSAVGTELTATPYSMQFNTRLFGNGTHKLTAVARDLAGNRGTDSLTVSINNLVSPPVTNQLVVYDDQLRSPFHDASWSAKVKYANSTPVNSGTRSVRVGYQSWGGFDILSGTWSAPVYINPTLYDTLRFSVYPTAKFDIAIGFYTGPEKIISPLANAWTTYAIPIPRSPFDRFYFSSQTSSAVVAYFDNIKFTGTRAMAKEPGLAAQPREFMLEQNYPNPFNPRTMIGYALPQAAHVSLRVFDALGKEVATLVDEQKEAGTYRVGFDATSIASGTYFYRIQAGEYTAVKKLMLVK